MQEGILVAKTYSSLEHVFPDVRKIVIAHRKMDGHAGATMPAGEAGIVNSR